MKKRLIVAALVSAMVFALVACGSERPSTTIGLPTPTGNAPAPTEKVEPQKAITSSGLTKLGQYKGIEVEKLALAVSEDDVDVNFYLCLVDSTVVDDDAVVKFYDYVNIDFVGRVDGKEFEGGSSDPAEGGNDVLIGSGSFIPGFEEGIVGMKKGETKTVKVTFPAEYKAELAGKDAEFDITVNSIKVFPEITDALVAENTEFETVDALKKDIRDYLEQQAQKTIDSQFQNDVFDKIIAGCEFDDSIQKLVDAKIEDMKYQDSMYAEMYQMDLETFVGLAYGLTLDVYNKQVAAAADYRVKIEKVLIAVSEAEKYTVTEDEYTAYVNTIIADNGFESREALEALYTREFITEGLLMDRASEMIFNSAVAKEAQSDNN